MYFWEPREEGVEGAWALLLFNPLWFTLFTCWAVQVVPTEYIFSYWCNRVSVSAHSAGAYTATTEYILGGFKFILFWNFNRNHTEIDRYWQKNNFLLFAKCLKMYSFFRICILRLQKVLLWPKIWVSKTRRILCWFQIRWCRLKQMPLKKARAKKLCEFWVFSFFCIFSWFFAFNFC
jgi:hypothetical protein